MKISWNHVYFFSPVNKNRCLYEKHSIFVFEMDNYFNSIIFSFAL
jgi:hypothetical protein